MSDVLIRGMEMPTRCGECLLAKLSPTGESIICNYMLSRVSWEERPFDCPLVHVPPHGRLIAEADAVETAWMILRGLGYLKEENHKLEQTVREVFATAPAIEVE